ncbi:MAG: hypothetical protein M3277_09130, partial [Actinomycetota bacterium]|nr:hypothetical protein [Actinomycetota bacterium]
VKARLSNGSDDVVVELRDSQVPLIYVGAAAGEAGEIAGRLRAAGAQATIIANAPALVGGAPERVKEGYQVVCPCVDPAVIPAGKDFAQAFGEAYDEPPGPYATEMYDVTNLVLEALRGADLPGKPEQLRAHIVDRFASAEGAAGISGGLEWAPTGELVADPGRDVWVYDWQASAGAFIGLGPVAALR